MSRDLQAAFVAPGSKIVMEACGRRIEQAREFSDVWLAGVQRTVDSGLGLAAQLARCADPAEATRLYGAWVNDCRDRLFADGRSASEMWIKACRNEAELLLSLATQPVRSSQSSAAAG